MSDVKNNKILIIEDDETIVQGLIAALTFHEFEIFHAESSESGLPMIGEKNPNLVILDVMLPGLDGFDACKKIREHDKDLPIIMLTAKSMESDKLLGFELGADDYVTKPFSAKELIARVRAVLKRTTNIATAKAAQKGLQKITIGEAKIDFDDFTICRGGNEFSLSPKEHAILRLFVTQPDTVISRSKIIDGVWGDDYFPSPKTIDNFVVKLRGKIEINPKKPRHILTVHGAGYKFKF